MQGKLVKVIQENYNLFKEARSEEERKKNIHNYVILS
jgi:hypothetical protein